MDVLGYIDYFYSQQPLTFLIITLIIILFFISIVRQSIFVTSANRKIGRFAKRVKAVQESSHLSKLTVEDQQWAVQNFLLENTEDGLLVCRENSKLVTVRPLITIALPEFRQPARHVPALLTTIGVFGTFLGVALGLSGVDMNITGSQQLLQSAVGLLGGMQIAFYTSLAGLGASVILLIVMSLLGKQVSTRLSEANANLYGQAIEASSITYLKVIAEREGGDSFSRDLKSNTEAVQGLASSLKTFIDNMTMVADSMSGPRLAQEISQAVSMSINSELKPSFELFNHEIKLLREIKEDNQKALVDSVISAIKEELIVPVASLLDSTNASLNESNEVSRKLNENVTAVLIEVGRTVESIDQFNKSTMSQLNEFVLSLDDVLKSFKSDTELALNAVTEKTKEVLDISVQGMEAQRDAFNASSKLAVDAFIKQTDILTKVGEDASRLMLSAKTELELGLGDIDTKILAMSSTVQSELEKFRLTYQDNLTLFFETQNNLLEATLGSQRDGLTKVVERFREIFEAEYNQRHTLLSDLSAQHENLQKSALTIEKLVKAIGLTEASTMAELQDIACSLGHQVADLKREYQQAAITFKEITEGVPVAIDKYLSHVTRETEGFFNGFDEAATRIHNRLAQAADFLIDARMYELESSSKEIA